jgi:hypothetical protein
VNRRLHCQSCACPLHPINYRPIILVDFDAFALGTRVDGGAGDCVRFLDYKS